MEELIKKIIDLSSELTILEIENKQLKEELKQLKEISSYLMLK